MIHTLLNLFPVKCYCNCFEGTTRHAVNASSLCTVLLSQMLLTLLVPLDVWAAATAAVRVKQRALAKAADTLDLVAMVRWARDIRETLRQISNPVRCKGDETTSLLLLIFCADQETCSDLWSGISAGLPRV